MKPITLEAQSLPVNLGPTGILFLTAIRAGVEALVDTYLAAADGLLDEMVNQRTAELVRSYTAGGISAYDYHEKWLAIERERLEALKRIAEWKRDPSPLVDEMVNVVLHRSTP